VPLLWVKRLPAMLQQLVNLAVLLGWQARQNIFQICIRIIEVARFV